MLVAVVAVIAVVSSNRSAKISLVTKFTLHSVCVPFGFPREKCIPFINMHNGQVHDVTYCYNLRKNAFLHTNEVSSQCLTILFSVLFCTEEGHNAKMWRF